MSSIDIHFHSTFVRSFTDKHSEHVLRSTEVTASVELDLVVLGIYHYANAHLIYSILSQL